MDVQSQAPPITDSAVRRIAPLYVRASLSWTGAVLVVCKPSLESKVKLPYNENWRPRGDL